MGKVSRRGLMLGVTAAVAGTGYSVRASATIMRSLSLPSLVQGSRHIVVLTPLSAESHYEELGRRRRVVTDTRVRIEEALAKQSPGSEVLVRTLGGTIGNMGELVHGQAQLALGEACVAFLLPGPDALYYVNGMAQGHYPLSSARRLLQSPDLPEIVDFQSSAVKALVGRELSPVREQLRQLSKP